MTRAVRHSQYVSTSPFMRWLREQPALDSANGYIATDLDCVWCNYRRRVVMLIECKSRLASVTYSQRQTLSMLHRALRIGLPHVGWQYRGMHLIQFEHSGPLDGRIWIDGREVDTAGLISFLSFR